MCPGTDGREMAELKAGDAAPAWRSVADDGREVDSAALAGRRYVLYFYPRDDTPGCTREACDFRDSFARLKGAGVEVFGVSTDPVARHIKFKQKHALPFTLLADPEKKLVVAFGAEGSLSTARRVTFLISPDGRVEKIWPRVKVKGHVEEILRALERPV
jgi:peroxiredoxin Q/BCP